MMFSKKAVYIVGAKRTPFCHYGGPLRELPASHAFAVAAKEAIQSSDINPIFVNQTVVGNVNYLSQCDGGKTPRYCGIYSGVPIDRPALGVNKSCGSGLQAIINGSLDLLIGASNVCLVGGTEIMSTLPFLVRNVRFGTALGSIYELEDHITHNFYDSYCGFTIQEIAEETAKKHNIGRREADEYTLQSFKRWIEANKANVFSKELTSVTVNMKKKETQVDTDQLIQMNKERFSKLPVIINDGTITTENSASAADGAAALVMASEEAIKTHGSQPLARIVNWACVGDDPTDSVAGVVSTLKNILTKQNLKINDVDLYEINETFASDILVIQRELKLDLNRVNVNGGALSLGHPTAATGARMATHLVHELKRRNLRRGIAASSCGAGQGAAVLIERE